jgi:hypothetical protein
MIYCRRCKGRLLVDRQYSSQAHLEVYCIRCGYRKFYHPPADTKEGLWLLNLENLKAKTTIASL